MAAVRQTEIAAVLREEIVAGRLKPGSRLPTRSELEDRFQASPTTLQRVFDRLHADGMVESRGRAGTFVARRPPHLTHYALVLHGGATDSRYYRTLASQAAVLSSGRPRVSTYFQVSGLFPSGDHERLHQDLEHQCLAGVIFGTDPRDLQGSPLLTLPGLPRVAIAEPLPMMPTVYPDRKGFLARGLEALAERGRRRVALVDFAARSPVQEACLLQDLARRGMTTRPEWSMLPNPRSPAAISRAVLLLLSLPADQRPDALMITDDNLVEAATAGIYAAGLPADALDVVGHCNFPDVPPASVPFIRLGFDFHQMLAQCLASIDAQRHGEAPAPHTAMPAFFDHELAQSR